MKNVWIFIDESILKHCKTSHAESTNRNGIQVGGFSTGTSTEYVQKNHRKRYRFWKEDELLNP